MIQQLRNSRFTCCGCADVPMSKSFGRRPSSRSRTLPPTRQATCSYWCSRVSTLSASGSISDREIGWSARAMTVGGDILGHAFYQVRAGLCATYCPACSYGRRPGSRRCSTMRGMGTLAVGLMAALVGTAVPVRAEDHLSQARAYYNQELFELAMKTAAAARTDQTIADEAELIIP